ncbi:MAG: T9SS type A sorting domain-containing protein [Saprospiraceae bacterium]|nr:T9SS type A sorting domain-containing protein [Saprospiraceae bacterium]
MRQLATLVVWCAFFGIIIGQNRLDNSWVVNFKNIGGQLLTFTGDSLNIQEIMAPNVNTYEALACISDSFGNLLFYTNNCTIFDKNHQIMEGGEGMNPGQIQTYWCTVNPFANPNDNSVIILPQPGTQQVYQVFHWDYEAFNVGQPGGSQFAPLHLYHTTVDMSENNGLGKVVSMNNLIIDDTLNSCALQAVRHANGRDWWVLAPEFNGNCYYKVLLGPTGVSMHGIQCIGSPWGRYGSGSALFTNDGTKYVRSSIEYGLNVFDFDRCSGQLSNPKHIPIGPQGSFLLNCMTLSPSGRFAYYHTLKDIYQYDLEAADIGASKTLVATYDGFVSLNQTDFYKSQLAPDGKIYINSFGPVYHMHVIDYPDSPGVACTVRQHAIELPNYHFAAMPNYPNYRLGNASGVCDTILSNTNWEPNAPVEVLFYPNPFSTELQVKLTTLEYVSPVFVLYDLYGRVVKIASLTDSNTLIPVLELPPGLYVWTLRLNEKTLQTGKLVKH